MSHLASLSISFFSSKRQIMPHFCLEVARFKCFCKILVRIFHVFVRIACGCNKNWQQQLKQLFVFHTPQGFWGPLLAWWPPVTSRSPAFLSRLNLQKRQTDRKEGGRKGTKQSRKSSVYIRHNTHPEIPSRLPCTSPWLSDDHSYYKGHWKRFSVNILPPGTKLRFCEEERRGGWIVGKKSAPSAIPGRLQSMMEV